MDKNKSIQALQAYATGFAAQGLSKLGEKYAELLVKQL